MDSDDFRPRGVYAACITAFRDDESLYLDRLGRHIDWMLDAGVNGVMVIGGCGEYANLTPEERNTLVTAAVEIVGGRVPVVVGALAPSTREVLEIGVHAASAGADALLVLPPYYIKPSFDGVLQHFEAAAKETNLDLIVYNNPGRTGWPLSADHLVQLADIPGVVAVKECDRDMAVIQTKMAKLGSRTAMLSGDDDLGFYTILAGADGAIWASVNLCPKLCVDLYNACVAQDIPTALAIHRRILEVFNAWMLPNHPGPLKQAMAQVGRSVGPARRPLALMSEAELGRLTAALDANGPID